MVKFLHSLSGFAFYLLGLSFFAAYVLLRSHIGGAWPALWLQVADLPLALTTILYGGTSLYLSLRSPERRSALLAIVIAVPLVCLFAALVTLNFWKVIKGL